MLTPPKMRELTIEVALGLKHVLYIEALTAKANEWVNEHAPTYGRLYSDQPKKFSLYVFSGYQRDEVAEYLQSLWDEQQWPADVEVEGEAQRQ